MELDRFYCRDSRLDRADPWVPKFQRSPYAQSFKTSQIHKFYSFDEKSGDVVNKVIRSVGQCPPFPPVFIRHFRYPRYASVPRKILSEVPYDRETR